jgi:hypothetical protein
VAQGDPKKVMAVYQRTLRSPGKELDRLYSRWVLGSRQRQIVACRALGWRAEVLAWVACTGGGARAAWD